MLRYAATIFLSAFLLFLVQPLIGNYILPWFGGGSGVWTVCILFFQAALLAGYAYAHVVTVKMPPRTQMWLHLALLAASAAMLPIIPADAWKPEPAADPTWQIIVLLTATLGLPFITLATTGPLLQAWFSRTHGAASPYRLYALSNAGSLLALLSFPFLFEPLLTRRTQALAWSAGFVVFALLCAYTAIKQPRTDTTTVSKQPRRTAATTISTSPPPSSIIITFHTTALWALLPACAVVVMLSTTSHLSDEISPAPFLWVLALGVYLLTFIFCFEWPWLYCRSLFAAFVLAAPFIIWLLSKIGPIPLGWQVTILFFITFSCCMVCHGELHRLRPVPQRLTAYYLMIAAGGALGGVLVSIIAPLLFATNMELFLSIYGTIGLLIVCMMRDPASRFHRGNHRLEWLSMIVIALTAGLLLRMRLSAQDKDVLVRARNFYGTLELRSTPAKVQDLEYRRMMHGRIEHGAQHFHPTELAYRLMPTLYYGPDTGMGILLREFRNDRARRVGIVGLGAGTAAVYARPGDTYRIYEINPQVLHFADNYFTFLADARARQATIEVVLGDARLMLEREAPQQYDVLVLDAFSGDAIPVHLLTREAFDMYQRHLNDTGAIAVHISNKYLDLRPVVRRLADHLGWTAVTIRAPTDRRKMLQESTWMIVTANQELLNLPAVQQSGHRSGASAPRVLWTDDQHSLFSVLHQLPPYGGPQQ